MNSDNNASGRIRIGLLGDILLNGEYLNPFFQDKFIANVRWISQQLGDVDIRIGNWETPLIAHEGANPQKKLCVYTDEDSAVKVLPLGLNVVSIAGNHIFDCLASGFQKTISFLDRNGIASVGAAYETSGSLGPLLLSVRDSRLAVLAYVDSSTTPELPLDPRIRLNMLEPDRIIQDVLSLSLEKYVVLVSLHWGRMMSPYPSPEQRVLARRIIDAGASVVFGHHTHRLQGHEKWKHGHIFYSLGNFLAGTLFPNVPTPGVCEPTMAVTLELLGREVIGVKTRHFVLSKGLLSENTDANGRRIEEKLNKPLEMSEKEYNQLWIRTVIKDLFLFRPFWYIRRNKSPWKIVANINKKQFSEFPHLLKKLRQFMREN